MSDDDDMMDGVFDAMEILLSLAPVPGVAAAAIAIKEIYRFIKKIALRKAECEALLSYASAVTTTIHYARLKQSQMTPAVKQLQTTIENMQINMNQWKNYNRAMAMLKNSEILDSIKKHRGNLERAITMVGLAQDLEQASWNARFTKAREKDSELLDQLTVGQVEIKDAVQALQVQIAQLSAPSHEVESAHADALQKLYDMRSNFEGSGVLPYRELTGAEVQKLGGRPAHTGSIYDIWKGVWLGKYFVSLKGYRDVEYSPHELERLDRQVDLWRAMIHPNILQLYGKYQDKAEGSPPFYFVSPWLEKGDVMRYLTQHPEADRLKFIRDVAMGLQYLHGVSILHGGLKGSNVLVNEEGSAVLSDFSLSKIMEPDSSFTMSNGLQADLRWMAPEAQSQQIMSSSTDVYAWAMTALEIVSGHIPFYTIKSIGKVVIAIGKDGLLPKREDYVKLSPLLKDDRLWSLLMSCWSIEPEDRPPVSKIIEAVDELRKTPFT